MFLLVGYFFACQYLILANEQIKETENLRTKTYNNNC